MTRTERLFDLIQLLRAHRRPVSGRSLGRELGISIRTLYRDIATLQAQGAPIEGEAGLGYILRPGFTLPPLMFATEEIEALVLGSRWVARSGDLRLGVAARQALAKIAAVLPADLRETLDAATLLVGPRVKSDDPVDLAAIRAVIRSERKLAIEYENERGDRSTRTVWPFALGYFDCMRILVAWCELRQATRHFRVDRIGAATPLDARYPRRRAALLKEWRLTQPEGGDAMAAAGN